MAEKVTVLRTERVPVEAVHPHPLNARRGRLTAIERSLREHGQYAPLVVHEPTGHIIKGNHTYRALRERLGAADVLVTFVSCTEAKALAVLAVDNKTSDGAEYDDAALAALLTELDEAALLTASGYSRAELDVLAVALAEPVPWQAIPDPPPMPAPAPAARAQETPSPFVVPMAPPAPPADLPPGPEPERTLALVFPASRFARLLDQLGELADTFGVDENAEVVAMLAERAIAELEEPEGDAE